MASYQLDTPYSSQVIFLNSQNCVFKTIDGTGSYDYSFQTPIMRPTNCRMLLSITDAQIPNISPTITPLNNKLSFHIPTFSRFFTITLDTVENNTISVYQFLNIVNEKIVYEALEEYTLYGTYDATSAKIKWISNFPFQIIDEFSYPTTCGDLIGLKKDRSNNFVYESEGVLLSSIVNPSFHITMPSSVDFNGSRFFFIKFKNITVNNLNSNGITDNAIVRIDNNAPLGNIVFYRPIEVHRFLIEKDTISNISFTITDTRGRELNIFSNDAQITLKIEYVYKGEMRSMEEGTINYELRKLAKIPMDSASINDVYDPFSNQFNRE
jgi:hypothetical protein